MADLPVQRVALPQLDGELHASLDVQRSGWQPSLDERVVPVAPIYAPDTALLRVRRNQAFSRCAQFAASVGNINVLQLCNLSSTVDLYVPRVWLQPAAAQRFDVAYGAAPLGGLAAMGPPADGVPHFGFFPAGTLRSEADLYSGVQAAASVFPQLLWTGNVPANNLLPIDFRHPVRCEPGTGIVLQQYTVNSVCYLGFEWIEVPTMGDGAAPLLPL